MGIAPPSGIGGAGSVSTGADVEEGHSLTDCTAPDRTAEPRDLNGTEGDPAGRGEVVSNPDLRVEGEETLEEAEPEESPRGEPETTEVAEPEEEEHAAPEDEAKDPEKRRNIDLRTETSTETDERRSRTCHVPGGAWLTVMIVPSGEETLEEAEPEENPRGAPETREVAEPEEEEHATPEDEAEDPETRRNIDLRTETSTETDERRNQIRHVPGGAWLTQAKQHGILRALRRDLANPEWQFRDLEEQNYASGDVTFVAESTDKLNQFDEAGGREVCYLGKAARARRYGEGDGAGRTLANLLCRPWASDYIVELVDDGMCP
ncbi:hypothetical protein NDU88_008694 [Pleurodeles waltl]|uniref:Uncharacterized protein n=1 Tax=Pleurodeles waltl TaxID=8319 RepID=A0AAV7PPW5_PLEWA|nr:hypothetical protein NDU88_008694 [Pleurodeles waltl]